MSILKQCRSALCLFALAGSLCKFTSSSAAEAPPPSPDVLWPMLLKLVASPSLRIDPAVAGAALGVPADRFQHIEPTGRDEPVGDVLGPGQGWPFYLDLPYADSSGARQGARFSFIEEWPVRRTTALPMCIDADRARVDITAAGWTYLGKTSDWTSKPWPSYIVAHFERQVAGSKELLLLFYNASSQADDAHGCLFYVTVDPDPGLADANR